MKILLFAVVLTVSFSPALKAADVQKGQGLYKNCILCHGENGEGKQSQKAPQIAGQYDWYIIKSLNDFKSGARKNPVMMPYIKGLSQTDFEDLAAYIGQLKVK